MTAISLLILLPSVALVCTGILTYTGKWTGWAESTNYLIYGGFAAPLFGVAFISVSFWDQLTGLGFPTLSSRFYILMGLAIIGFLRCRASFFRSGSVKVLTLGGKLSAIGESCDEQLGRSAKQSAKQSANSEQTTRPDSVSAGQWRAQRASLSTD